MTIPFDQLPYCFIGLLTLVLFVVAMVRIGTYNPAAVEMQRKATKPKLTRAQRLRAERAAGGARSR